MILLLKLRQMNLNTPLPQNSSCGNIMLLFKEINKEGNPMKKKWLIPATLALLSGVALPVKAVETRCGWLINPTPQNWYLWDGDAKWTLSTQGGFQARGMDNLPRLSEKESVTINRTHAYFCSCLEVETDRSQSRITLLKGGEQLPLSTCREDPNLPAP